MTPIPSLRGVLAALSGTDATVECPTCAASVDVSDSECSSCGAVLLVECRSCGETIGASTDACPACEKSDFGVFRID
ncbi:small CPxCG-related zinc finger protein (plasmid) [Natronomonas pharaonis DSM 2160]|uniref:Small CPxCG-related zinc finger protein n=1 Tax=Natronomonas pharaonis (strain ATCC 35678 / DSM 2160 / CIP 103997 / JCM 8858 / NBRC 14720 / NCIMB 2260 / Gabara) TaxID=348780 RepID=I7L1Y1_NATPD|nr:small CPxCG-related zinc finger protein [Natronomonas pharaonis DSM 2160]